MIEQAAATAACFCERMVNDQQILAYVFRVLLGTPLYDPFRSNVLGPVVLLDDWVKWKDIIRSK